MKCFFIPGGEVNEENLHLIEEAVDQSLSRIRSHRFVRMAQAQQLDRKEVLRWMLCAGRESEIFPRILERMLVLVRRLQGCREQQSSGLAIIEDVLRQNLDDEYGNGDPDEAHFCHYLKLLAEMELTEEDFRSYEERAGVTLALDLALNVAGQNSLAVAIGYMLVNEEMTPVTYDAVDVASWRGFPGIDRTFFRLHVEVDEQHVADLYRAVAVLPDEERDDVLYGIALGERGMGVLLDEVVGVFDSVPSGGAA